MGLTVVPGNMIQDGTVTDSNFTNTTITGEVDTIAIGDSAAGTTYTATSAYTPTSSY